jgi:hypothetical protein
MRALEVEPERRHGSIGEMRVALDAAVRAPDRDVVPDAVTQTIAAAPEAAGQTREYTQPLAPAPSATPPSPPPPSPPPPSPPGLLHDRRRQLLLGIALGLILGLGAAAVFAGGGGTPEVPDLVGMRIGEARDILEEEGLAADVRRVDSEAARGVVLAQSLPDGLRVAEGATVELDVSSGTPPCCEVPSVEGLEINEARRVLEDAHLEVGPGQYTEGPYEKDTVIDQSPSAGETVEPGTPVALVIAEGEGRGEGKGKGKGKGDDDDD